MSLRRLLLTAIVGACLMAVPCAAAQLPSNQTEYGADCYAEDWPPKRVEADAPLMEQARFRTERAEDTNWERLEPQEGRYNFAWIDRVIYILKQHRIRTVLSISSYVPPAWLTQKHAEFHLVNEDGARRRLGRGDEFLAPQVLVRTSRAGWEAAGRKETCQIAREQVRKLSETVGHKNGPKRAAKLAGILGAI